MNQLLLSLWIIITLCAVVTIISYNPIHSLMWLVLTFLSSSILTITLGFDFLGLLIIIVYVGAIAILFLFVIMMLDIIQLSSIQSTTYLFLIIIFLSVLTLVELGFLLWDESSVNSLNSIYSEWNFESLSHITIFSLLIYSKFSTALIIISVLLLIGMVGVIVLTLEWGYLTKSQNLSTQHHSNNSWT